MCIRDRGGSASSLTTYTLLSNLLAAVVVPLVFPWVEPHADVDVYKRQLYGCTLYKERQRGYVREPLESNETTGILI